MSDQAPETRPAVRAPRTFREMCLHAANPILAEILDPDAAREAAARVAMALGLAARNNASIERCTPASIGAAIAYCAAAEMMPGGPRPAIWLIPRTRWAKTGEGFVELMELNVQVSTAGYQQLAARAGYAVTAVAVYLDDVTLIGGTWIPVIDGEYLTIDVNAGRSPPIRRKLNAAHNLEDFAGVVVVTRRLDTGAEVGWTFVDRHMIAERRAISDSWDKAQKALDPETRMDEKERKRALKTPWIEWPEEMALKTGVRYGVARGIVPLDDIGMRLFEVDGKADAIDTTAETMPRRREPHQITSSANTVVDDVLSEPSEAEKARIAAEEREQAERGGK